MKRTPTPEYPAFAGQQSTETHALHPLAPGLAIRQLTAVEQRRCAASLMSGKDRSVALILTGRNTKDSTAADVSEAVLEQPTVLRRAVQGTAG